MKSLTYFTYYYTCLNNINCSSERNYTYSITNINIIIITPV